VAQTSVVENIPWRETLWGRLLRCTAFLPIDHIREGDRAIIAGHGPAVTITRLFSKHFLKMFTLENKKMFEDIESKT